ncbi:hypothetical protein AN218_03660 [Streptomyces nanshensis]|uniref:Uncharacterized protein n=1 Tax=Streptomyces nanshensis TaxID=518642 RepID=A0A1E7LB23_9ACTN|nr:hypothetical protein AN218_03660 [Streptomyces nanshensis]
MRRTAGHSTPAAQPVTPFERDQARAAFRALLDAYGETLPGGLPARWAVRKAFGLGWAMCARTGSAPLALADVPLPLPLGSVREVFEAYAMGDVKGTAVCEPE